MFNKKINVLLQATQIGILLLILSALTSLKQTTQIPHSEDDSVDTEVLNASVLTKETKAVTPQRQPTEAEAAYISRFAKVAIGEMNKYNIPASVTLAQGILESNRGQSKLAKKTNNHFGIKCFSKKCPSGHCSNHTDDSHKDFFKIYETAWASYRDHSKLLQKPRYKSLYNSMNYADWATGLKRCGYATSKTYAADLIRLIESLNLTRYDKE